MFQFFKRVGRYWWMLALMIVTILLNIVADLCIPNEMAVLINDLQKTTFSTQADKMTAIALDSLWMFLFACLSAICATLTGRMASFVTAHIISVSRYELYKRVGEFSMEEMNKFSVSSLVTRSTNDLTFVGSSLNLIFRYLLYGPIMSILAIIFLVIKALRDKSFEMMIAVIVTVVILFIFIIILIRIAIPKYRAIQAKLDKVTLVSRENLEGLRVVRAYNAEDFQEEKFGNVNADLMKTERFSNRALGLLLPGIQLTIGLCNVAIYIIGAVLVPAGTLNYSDISVVSQYAALILLGFVLLTLLITQLPRCLVCMKRVNEVIAYKPSIQGKEVSPESNEVGTIEYRNVSFKYPGAEKPVLENVSFKVKKGETIAFIGATGSGKSTLINLLPRLFDATEGEVLVDGINVKEYNLKDLNNKFGYVPQRGYLFHDSLVNNITLGKTNANPAQIQRALEISQSSEFVSKLPGGLDYEISQGGKNVSGGQRQRLCIARAIIMEPEIFIFDDSFSALDYRTDKILRGEIKEKCNGVTNVIVAQRVGTIIDADQIIVLDFGKVVGHGTHKELLKSCPVYREIAVSQLGEEEVKNACK